MEIVLETKNLTKTFNPQTHAEVKAIKDINFSLKKGEIVMIMGPSGSGKTTLLTMIGGLLKATAGSISINSSIISDLSNRQLTKIRQEKIGFVFQSFNLLENLTALENVMIAGFKVKDQKAKATELLTKLGLGDRLQSRPKSLSGGERQRVAIARALIDDPVLILADEPTANLDSQIGHQVMQLFCSIGCEQDKSIVIVSHDERIKDVAHRVLYIEDGQLIKEERGNHNKICTMKNHSFHEQSTN